MIWGGFPWFLGWHPYALLLRGWAKQTWMKTSGAPSSKVVPGNIPPSKWQTIQVDKPTLLTWPIANGMATAILLPKKKHQGEREIRRWWQPEILLTHQLIWRISHYLQVFIRSRWCRISSINSMSNQQIANCSAWKTMNEATNPWVKPIDSIWYTS